MYILVDGYNVLKQISARKEISEHERQRFINQLRKYAQQKGHTIILVFDGGSSTWPTKTEKQGVGIIYSGIKQSADDVIKKMLNESGNKDVLLVSSDNELYVSARTSRASVMDAVAFYHLIMQSKDASASAHKGNIVKTSQEEDPYIDALMAGVKMPAEYKPEEEAIYTRKSPAITPSKKERELLKKIKKL